MLKIPIVLMVSYGLSFPNAAEAFSYECKSDLSVGYAFSEALRAWAPTQFRAQNTYIVRPLTDEEAKSPLLFPKNATWGVLEPDGKFPTLECPEPSHDQSSDRIVCGGMGLGFVLNTGALRFQKVYGGGYVGGVDNNDDTPFIEIGRCKFIQH